MKDMIIMVFLGCMAVGALLAAITLLSDYLDRR